MAEAGGCSGDGEAPAKVRVVRCPKCEKLLPELAGFSVYRCGGCSATLQALMPKLDEPSLDTLEKFEEQMERSSMDAPLFHCHEENSLSVGSVSGSELKGNDVVFGENPEDSGGHPSRTEVNHFSNGHREFGLGKTDFSGGENFDEDNKSRCSLRTSKAPVGRCGTSVDGMVKAGIDVGRGKKLLVGHGNGMQKIQCDGTSKSYIGDFAGVIHSSPRASLQGVGTIHIPDEGPSNVPPRKVNGHFQPYRHPVLPHRVENLENDRMELLKKLDELREQLSQSCNVADVSNDRPPLSWNAAQNLYSQDFSDQKGIHDHDGWYQRGMSCSNLPASSHSSFVNNRHNLHLQNFSPEFHSENDIYGCGMPVGSRVSGVAPYAPYSFCKHRGSPNFTSGQFGQDLMMPYPYYHQPTCSCSHFCNQNWQVPPTCVPATTLMNGKGPIHTNTHGFYPVNGSSVLDSNGGNGASNSSIISSNNMNCQRLPTSNAVGRDCRPLAGGAPFVVCCNCSELLQVPQKHMLMGKGQYKLRCGSCCQVILVELDNDGLVVCDTRPAFDMNIQFNRASDCRNPISVDSYYAEDYNRPGFNSSLAGEKAVLTSNPLSVSMNNEMIEKEERMNLAEADNMERRSSSSSAYRDERSPDAMLQQRDASSSRELQNPDVILRAPGLPLREHFGYSPAAVTANRVGTGSRSKRSEQEKVGCINGNFKHNSVRDVAVATEMDLLVDEYPNTRLSEDSDEASKEEDLSRTSKGGESFFTGLIKKSFKDFSRSNQHHENRKSKVSINGCPLSDRVVRKAERLAGPIQPGEYWYDYHAGFWGALGQHCLGIIPPFIEELNYPMPRNCAGGDTGVLVNGRELHQKDLSLLASRGLPVFRDRSYIIDISGKVSDAISGVELDGLGKLAPTVEKMKHGFGMRVPKEMSH